MKNSSAWRWRRWERNLIRVSTRRNGLPEGLLEWTGEHFGKSTDIQRLFGLENSLKPESETAVKVLDHLANRGVILSKKQRKR